MYRVRLLDAAIKELVKLDKPVARRVTERVHWLGENIADANIEALAGEFEGLFKLRVGTTELYMKLFIVNGLSWCI